MGENPVIPGMIGDYSLGDGLASVGLGWSGLVLEAFANRPPGVEIVQVKEKFGLLRIYHAPHNDEFETKLDELEDRSGKICEQCGRRGRLTRDKRWMMTLCRKHRDERGRK